MVIVTGGTGHIGNVLVRHLLKKGYHVAIIDKSPASDPAIKGLPVKYFQVDIRDTEKLLPIFKQADTVIHLAGIISIMPGKEDLLRSVNIEGTKSVLEACKDTKVKKLIYISTVHALYEPPKGTPIIEKLAEVHQVLGEYSKTKVIATQEVRKAFKEGLKGSIVYPTGVIGPYDFKNSEMGTLIRDSNKYSKIFYLQGGYNFVDVRDLAKGILLTLEKGKNKEEYILGGHGLSIYELFNILAKLTKSTPPKIKVPDILVKFVLPMSEFVYRLIKRTPIFTKYSVDVLNSNYMVSSKKAQKTLGYTYRNIEESIKDTFNWMNGKKISIE